MILMMLLSIQKIAFFCETYKKHHVSYPVVMSSRNLSLLDIWMMSPEMFIHVSFCLGVRLPGSKRWHTRRMFNTSWRILWQFPIEISNLCCNLVHRFPISQTRTCSTFASFVDVDGRPLRGPPSMVSRPSRQRLCQSSTWNCFIALPPCDCCNMIDIQLVISATKHKILYSYVVKLQNFTPKTRHHAH